MAKFIKKLFVYKLFLIIKKINQEIVNLEMLKLMLENWKHQMINLQLK